MKWVQALPEAQGAYVIGLGKSYRVEHPWTALGSGLGQLELFRAAHTVLEDCGVTFGELWLQGEDGPTMCGMWVPSPYPQEDHSGRIESGFWVTSTKNGQGHDALDPAAVLLLGPGVFTSRRFLHHRCPKATNALVHLPEIEEHHFQRGQAAEMSGEPFWEKYARSGDYISVHTFIVLGVSHRRFSVDCSGAHALDAHVDGYWQRLVSNV